METTLEYYLGIDTSNLDNNTLAAKFEILKKLRAKEKDHSLNDILELLNKR